MSITPALPIASDDNTRLAATEATATL
jgi:hypothetical protein